MRHADSVQDQRELAERVSAQLDDIQRLAHLGCWEWDIAADRVTWTDPLYDIYGIEPGAVDATYNGYLSRVHPDDRERVAATIEGAYRDGAAFDFEERIVRPDGTVRLLRSRGRVERGPDGGAIRLVGVCHDVTDMRAAQDAAVQLAAERAARVQAQYAADRQQFLAEATATLSSSLDYHRTLRNVACLAVPAITDWCAIDLLDESGDLVRLAVEHPDPARVTIAHELAQRYPSPKDESRGRWRVIATGEAELVEELPDAVIEAAAQDAEHLAMLRGLGLRSYVVAPLRTADRTLGTMTFVQAESGRHFTPADLPLLEDLARRGAVAIANAHLVRDLEQAHAALEEQASELEALTIELESQTEELQQTMQELEARHEEIERQRAAADTARTAADEANRAKSDFLATMSHELRTPLNAISGYTQLLEIGLHGPVNERQIEMLGRIQRNQQRLLALVTDVLNFTRIDAGRLEVQREPVSVSALVSDLEPVIEPQARAKGLQLELSDAADLYVLGDRERAEQVLINLVSNAIKFTPAGGVVTIAAVADGGAVRIQVADTGPGIPPDLHESIFDPFVQVGPHLTRGAEGVGLGLAISRELARAMDGDVEVSTGPGGGAVFSFSLVAAPSQDQPPLAPAL